jgi:hypothetical protein
MATLQPPPAKPDQAAVPGRMTVAGMGSRSLTGLLVMLLATAVAAAVCIRAVVFLLPPNPEALSLEFVKALIQIAMVLVIGQAVSVVIKERELDRLKAEKDLDVLRQALDKKRDDDRASAEKERDIERAKLEKERDRALAQLEARRNLLQDWHKRLVTAYIGIKKHRRLLRAHALYPPMKPDDTIDSDARILKKPYDEHMKALNDVDGVLDGLLHELRVTLSSESKGVNALIPDLESIRGYLRDLIQQYERHYSLDPTAEWLSLATLDDAPKQKSKPRRPEYRPGYLGDFLGPVKTADGEESHLQAAVFDRLASVSQQLRLAILTDPASVGWRREESSGE